MSEVKRYTPSMRVGHMVKDKDGLWNRSQDFDRVTAERDAALGREASEIELRRKHAARIHELSDQVKDMQQRLTAADARADVLEQLLRDARHYHGVQLLTDPPKDAWKYHRVSERIDSALNPKPDATARPWGPYYSTEVITAAVDFKLKPAECDHSYHHFGTEQLRRRCNLCKKLEPAEGGGDVD